MNEKIGPNLVPSVCIDAVYHRSDAESAIRHLHDLGYRAFEFWAWWEKDLTLINQLCSELKMTVAACCTKFISLVHFQSF